MHEEKQNSDKVCKVLKLSNGETIIGNISKETPSYIDVDMPLKILFMIHPDGVKMNLSVLKWDPTIDYNYPVRVYKTSIVACAEPNNMMMNNYNEILTENDSKEDDQKEDDEITELNDVMTELLKKINPRTMH